MLALSTEERRQLRTALISGFRNYSSLKMFVSDHFNFRLDEIAESRATGTAADNLIEHFEEGGKDGDISSLILALHQARPNNPEVHALASRLTKFLQQRIVLDPRSVDTASNPFQLPEPYNDLELESFLPEPLSYESDVGKLQRGLQLANAVCRISFTDRATTGTGVLIAPDLVLTNYHVLSKQVPEERSQFVAKAKTALFEFGFVSKEQDVPISPDVFEVAVTEPILSFSPPSQLDYVLLRVERKIIDTGYIKPVQVGATSSPLLPRDGLNVLQHPEGKMLQVSLSASGVVQVRQNQGRVWYVNRTQGGSSGSPCFNRDWEMVALHHASVSRGFGSVREGILLEAIWTEIVDFL